MKNVYIFPNPNGPRRFGGRTPSERRQLSQRRTFGRRRGGPQPPRYSRARPPMLDMRPDGTFRQLRQRLGRSLPGYEPRLNNPIGRMVPISRSPAQRAIERVILGGIRNHPAVRLLNLAQSTKLALDIIDHDYSDLTWAEVDPGQVARQAGFPFEETGAEQCANNQPLQDFGHGFVVSWRSGGTVCDLLPITGQPYGPWNSRYDSNGENLSGGDPAGSGMWQAYNDYSLFLVGAITNPTIGRATWQQEWQYPNGYPDLHVQPPRPAVAARVTMIPTNTPPAPAISVSSRPRPGASYNPKPYQQPMLERRADSKPRLALHYNLRPPRGQSEKKSKTSRHMAYKLISALYDATTEAHDIIEILYKNMRIKGNHKSMSAKAHYIASNLHLLNVRQATLDIIRNHYEDKIYGRIFGILGKHTPFGSMTPGTGAHRKVRPIRRAGSGPPPRRSGTPK